MTEETPRWPWVVRFLAGLLALSLVGLAGGLVIIGVTWVVAQFGFDLNAHPFIKAVVVAVLGLLAMFIWAFLTTLPEDEEDENGDRTEN